MAPLEHGMLFISAALADPPLPAELPCEFISFSHQLCQGRFFDSVDGFLGFHKLKLSLVFGDSTAIFESNPRLKTSFLVSLFAVGPIPNFVAAVDIPPGGCHLQKTTP